MASASVETNGGPRTGALLLERLAEHGSSAHPYSASPQLLRGATAGRDLADLIHYLCVLHGRYPGLIDHAAARVVEPDARAWLANAAYAFAGERAYLARLAVAAGPVPSTPGAGSTDAAVLGQRHAMENARLLRAPGLRARRGHGAGARLGGDPHLPRLRRRTVRDRRPRLSRRRPRLHRRPRRRPCRPDSGPARAPVRSAADPRPASRPVGPARGEAAGAPGPIRAWRVPAQAGTQARDAVPAGPRPSPGNWTSCPDPPPPLSRRHAFPGHPELCRHRRPQGRGQRRRHASAPASGQGRARHRQDRPRPRDRGGARRSADRVARQVDDQGPSGAVRI